MYGYEDKDETYYGDPRRCPVHPEVQTSSPDGMFDAPCGKCESRMEEVYCIGCGGPEHPPAECPAVIAGDFPASSPHVHTGPITPGAKRANVEFVECVDGSWMVTVDGIQWGRGPRDASGASSETFPTEAAARAEYGIRNA